MRVLVVAATSRELAGAPEELRFECGVGPVDAACATARLLAERRPDGVLHVGIAGCRRASRLEPPALVIGSEAVYDDADPASPWVASRVLPDEHLLAAALRALPEARLLPIASSARVDGSSSCDVEAMEGFAVLRACALAGVPAVELRAVSNEIEEGDRARWRFEEALAELERSVPLVLGQLAR